MVAQTPYTDGNCLDMEVEGPLEVTNNQEAESVANRIKDALARVGHYHDSPKVYVEIRTPKCQSTQEKHGINPYAPRKRSSQ